MEIKPKKYFTIQSDEIHIWSACLSDNELSLNFFTSTLSRDECERANSFRFSKDQKQFTVARGILRCLLANYLGVSPQNIKIAYGLWGKPCLPQEDSLRFNVSHSGDYALYALTLNFEVGIDLEYINDNLELEDMAMSILSLPELTYWRSLKPEERMNSFFKSWVCKEAFLKALGKGWLGIDKQVLFTEACDFKKVLRDDPLNSVLAYPYCFDLIPGYASAVFVDGPFLRLLHYNWNPQYLQKDKKYKQ